ncbi:hypothetical protein E0H75_38520 [Kribbella capetownensis]|uniref:Uncharacterized protein n=1 Tax=Kribbella capetownensis TaxID=1572659 RepID=A0A4R0JAE5_9ACTN|nr:hypothetical protein [Kribbella capetownensis]TCC42907.1 hypothetical protein E0H75_38520 [Kribbella capetownensis]
MPGQEEYDKLEGRIVRLEQQVTTRSEPDIQDITAEEFRIYLKVRDILAQLIGPGSGCAPGRFGSGVAAGGTGCAPGVIGPGDDVGGSGCAPGGFGGGAVGRFGDLGG